MISSKTVSKLIPPVSWSKLKTLTLFVSWFGTSITLPSSFHLKCLGVLPVVLVITGFSKLPSNGLILKVEIESWPLFETETNFPDGCKLIPPQVDFNFLGSKFSGKLEIVWIIDKSPFSKTFKKQLKTYFRWKNIGTRYFLQDTGQNLSQTLKNRKL